MRPRWLLLWSGLVLGSAFLLAGCDGPTGLVVNTTVDGGDANPGDGVCEMTVGDGDCSLRAAIDEANNRTDINRILVQSGDYELTVAGVDNDNSGGDLDLDPGHGSLLIAAAPPGASIDANGAEGVLDLRRGQYLLANIAVTGAAADGVTVRPPADAELSIFSGHGNGGAGLRVDENATAITRNATFSNNDQGVSVDGNVAINFTTIVDNVGTGIQGDGTAQLAASIVADQQFGQDCDIPAPTPPFSYGYNLASDNTCNLTATGDQANTPAELEPLSADTLPSHTPAPGSPARDVLILGSGLCQTNAVDQNTTIRPQGPKCDVGAIEADPTEIEMTVNSPLDLPDTNPGNGTCQAAGNVCTLRAAIDEANAYPSSDQIVVDVDVDLTRPGANEDLNGTGDLDITEDLTIEGNDATLDANGLDRVLDVRTGAHVRLRHFELTGGQSDGGGALRLMQSSGEIVGLTISGNAAAGDNAAGGGISLRLSELTIADTTISNNSATHVGPNQSTTAASGGGLMATESTVSIIRSTISGNSASGGAVGGLGSGVGIAHSTASITDSTISANLSESVFGPAQIVVGYADPGDSTLLTRTTVDADGEGALLALSAPVTLNGSIIDGGCGTLSAGTIDSTGYNVASLPSCGLAQPTDLPNTDPLLGPLQDNGGPTFTHLPGALSPARDSIPAGTPGLCDGTLPMDQRGVARPQGAACDRGSVEQ